MITTLIIINLHFISFYWSEKKLLSYHWRRRTNFSTIISCLSQSVWPRQDAVRGFQYYKPFMSSNFADIHQPISWCKGLFILISFIHRCFSFHGLYIKYLVFLWTLCNYYFSSDHIIINSWGNSTNTSYCNRIGYWFNILHPRWYCSWTNLPF